MDEGQHDTIDVSLWCRLCNENIGAISNADPHAHKARRFYLGYEIHALFMAHQVSANHLKLRRENGYRD
jgi:hypothetical protein